jgi:hypothetical protein
MRTTAEAAVLEVLDFAAGDFLGLADFGIQFNSTTAAAARRRIFPAICFDVGFGR